MVSGREAGPWLAVDMGWKKRVFQAEEIKAGVEDEEASQTGEK